MKGNIGPLDRVLRFAGAIVFTIHYVIDRTDTLTTAFCLIAGIILFSTAISGVCPFYAMYGVNTKVRNPTE